MAGLTKSELAGKAAYQESVKDIKDAQEWTALSPEERTTWIDSTSDAPVAQPATPASDAAAKVDQSKRATAKAKDLEDNALPVVEVEAPFVASLTLRDLAKKAYYDQEGYDADDFENQDRETIEHWEAVARRADIPKRPRPAQTGPSTIHN